MARQRPQPKTLTRGRVVLLAVSAAALLALVAGNTVGGDGGGDGGGAGSRPGRAAVLDVRVTATDGSLVRLGELVSGQPAVVNFFASWCGPCVREMPDFEAVHARRHADVALIGVNLQDSVDAMEALVERTGVTYPVVRDESGELFRAVDGFSMPTTVFLDARGSIVEVHGGQLSRGALEARIDQLLGA